MARVLRSLEVRVSEGRNDAISDVYIPSCPRDAFDVDGKDSWYPNFRLDSQSIDLDMLSNINPLSVELVDIFPSAASTPADARGNGCGAIVIFTRDAP